MTRGSVKFRHVVFADAARVSRGPIDFTPRLPAPIPISLNEDESPVGHEQEAFLRWLLLRVGLDVRMYRMETLNRRLVACLRLLDCDDVHEARGLLSANPRLVAPAISTLVIGVSSFFRDHSVFDRLRDVVLPELCGRGKSLRIWSVGCSDGQELYSVAMLLSERRVLHACHLLGTDCRSDAISRLREGVYEPAAIRSVPVELREKYFRPHSAGGQILSALRSAVHSRAVSVLGKCEAGPWDLILCRNMAMYLQPDAATALWQSLERCLRPGGVLMLGKAERPAAVKGLSYIGPCLYRRE